MEIIRDKGIVYKLYSYIDDYYYIGSTVDTLIKRKSKHKGQAKETANSNRPVCIWINDIGCENIKIIEMTTYENLSRRDLEKYEDEEIVKHKGNDNCLNCKRSYVTKEEAKETQKEIDKRLHDYKRKRHG